MAGIAGVVAATAGGNNASTSTATAAAPAEEPKVDLSIPYNAAAELAYQAWKTPETTTTLEEFTVLYEKKTVAQVTAKKVARDMKAAMEASEAAVASAEQELEKLK